MLAAMLLTFAIVPFAVAGEWQRLPPLPDKEGFAGSFAGVSNGVLVVAGGANFPGKKPSEGGKKVWYDSVFALEKPDGKWRIAGKLPRPLAYGVSVSHGDEVVCIGGSDSERHYSGAFRLEWKNGSIVVTELPPLPKPLANGCGALVGDVLYIAGGQENPDSAAASRMAWRTDLSAQAPKWERIDDCPGDGRILAVAAGFDDSFWLMGGAELVMGKGSKVERRYLTDAYRYNPGHGWKRIADLPHSVVAAPTPAPADASGFYLLGGDDGSQAGVSSDKHRGFSNTILRYNSKTTQWIEVGSMPAPRVTTPCVPWHGSWVVPSGEIRPGVRSPEVWSIKCKKKE
jgi:N-acetylneuraminate epimerase